MWLGGTGEGLHTNGRIELYGMTHGYAEAQGMVVWRGWGNFLSFSNL